MQHCWQQVISGKRSGGWVSFLRGGLYLVSLSYRAVIEFRNWLYARNWKKSERVLGGLVVSVGNLTVGGTGKTPLVILLAETFRQIPTAVLSRGYRSPAEVLNMPTILSLGEGPRLSSFYCGDEPFLIASRVPSVVVIVGKSRLDAARMAVASGCKLLLLDDGLQHRRLARDLEVIVLDAQDPLGGGHLLPRGALREPSKALSRADLIVINGVQSLVHFNLVKSQVPQIGKIPVVGTTVKVDSIETLDGRSVPSLMGHKVGLFCGIGKPEKFLSTIEALGAESVNELLTRDHTLDLGNSFTSFAAACKQAGAEYLICTEKDKVKLDPAMKSPLPIVWVRVKLEVVAGFDAWSAFCQAIRQRLPS